LAPHPGIGKKGELFFEKGTPNVFPKGSVRSLTQQLSQSKERGAGQGRKENRGVFGGGEKKKIDVKNTSDCGVVWGETKVTGTGVWPGEPEKGTGN